jgi:hypothetical protein
MIMNREDSPPPDRDSRPESDPRPERPPRRPGRKKDPRLESLISEWKKGEKERWRGHGKKDGKKKR